MVTFTKKELRRILKEDLRVEITLDRKSDQYFYPNEDVSFHERSSFENIFTEFYNLGLKRGKKEQLNKIYEKLSSCDNLPKFMKELDKKVFR